MSRTLLFIEDHQDIRECTTFSLERAGYTVLQASNGEDGLAHLAEAKVDLVLLDICMPGLDGWDVCRRIKDRKETRYLPVIFLTARDQPLDRVIGLEVVRADGYLTKPFEMLQLLDEVARLLPETRVPV